MKKVKWLAGVLILLMVGMCFAEYVPCKVNLNLFERLVLIGLLPAQGNFATLKIVGELRMELAPTEEEYKAAGLTTLENGGIQAKDWNAVAEKELVLGETAEGIIVDALKKMDKEKQLKPEHLSVYEKFISE